MIRINATSVLVYAKSIITYYIYELSLQRE